MTGISEILILILLIAVVLILPRMLKSNEASASSKKTAAAVLKGKGITMKKRAAVVASLAYPVIVSLFTRPWQGELILFLAVGILPVVLAWALFWIVSAPR